MTAQSNGGLYNSGTYNPAVLNLSAVTTGLATIATTASNHSYVVGQQVQFFIPPQYGIRQMDGLKGYISAVTNNTLTVNINSTNFDQYIAATATLPKVIDNAQVCAVGDANTGISAGAGGVLSSLQIPGTFLNTYP